MKVIHYFFILTLQFDLWSVENPVHAWELSLTVRTAKKLVVNFLLQKPCQVGLAGGIVGVDNFVLSLQKYRSQNDSTIFLWQHHWYLCGLYPFATWVRNKLKSPGYACLFFVLGLSLNFLGASSCLDLSINKDNSCRLIREKRQVAENALLFPFVTLHLSNLRHFKI